MSKYIFECFVSSKSFKIKPTDKETSGLNIQREYLKKSIDNGERKPFKYSLQQITKHLEDGKTINSSIVGTTRMLVLDIDNGITEDNFLKFLKENDIIPNIFYRTFSYNAEIGKYKMRCIYALDKERTAEQYKNMYKMLVSVFPKYGDKSILDIAMSNYTQLVHGTDKKVELIHENSFDPVKFAKKIGYVHSKKVQQQKKEFKSYIEFGSKLEKVLEQMNNDNDDYNRSYFNYWIAREFGLEDRMNIKESWITKHEKVVPNLDTEQYFYRKLREFTKRA
ncbi:MAG: hypothetical protein ACRC6A_08460 [Fusobacteriaceae bacterium]